MKIPHINYRLWFISAFLLVMVSCVDEDLFTFDDPAKIEDAISVDNVIWSPAFTAPIGKTTVSLNSLFEEYNEQIEIMHMVADSIDAVMDTIDISPYSDSTFVIYEDSIYLSDLPAIELDTTIQFNFGLTTQGINEQTTKIKYVTLIFNITNNYPTKIESQASFLDAGGSHIQDLFEKPLFIDGGTLDENGRVMKAYVNPSQYVTLKEDEIEDVLNTEYIQLHTKIWLKNVTPEHFDEVMKFFSDYKVEIQLAVDFQVEVQVGDYTENQ